MTPPAGLNDAGVHIQGSDEKMIPPIRPSHWIIRAVIAAVISCGAGVAGGFADDQETLAAAMRPTGSSTKSAKELVALGDQYAKGNGVERSEVDAARLYQQAASLGDPAGKVRLGEVLVFGRGLPVDMKRGLALIREAADQGNTAALVLFGDLTLKGMAGEENRKQGLELLASAAARGQLSAAVKLGTVYERGTLGDRDVRKAISYYRQAIAGGRADAMVNLGRMYVEGRSDGLGTPIDGVALLRQAQALGNDNAVVALSECYLRGKGVGRNGRKALKLLDESWQAGNVKAGLKLLALYRDGRKGSVRPNVPRARIHLGEMSRVLSLQELNKETFLLEAKGATTKAARETLRSEFSRYPISDRETLLRTLQVTNVNLYIAIIQVELKRLGLLQGSETGRLSRGTVNAIYQYCRRLQAGDICRKGPLASGMANLLTSVLQAEPSVVADERRKVSEAVVPEVQHSVERPQRSRKESPKVARAPERRIVKSKQELYIYGGL